MYRSSYLQTRALAWPGVDSQKSPETPQLYHTHTCVRHQTSFCSISTWSGHCFSRWQTVFMTYLHLFCLMWSGGGLGEFDVYLFPGQTLPRLAYIAS